MTAVVLDDRGRPRLALPRLIGRLEGAHLAPGGGTIAPVDYIAGCENCTALVTVIPSANNAVLYLVPFVSPPFACSVDRLAFEVTTAQAGTTAQIGLFDNYDQDPVAGGSGGGAAAAGFLLMDRWWPGRALAVSGAISTASTGLKTYSVSPAAALAPNRLYWMGLALPDATTQPTLRAIAAGALVMQVAFQAGGSLAGGFVSTHATESPWFSHGPHQPNVAMTTIVGNVPALRYRLAA